MYAKNITVRYINTSADVTRLISPMEIEKSEPIDKGGTPCLIIFD
jgi:hypothetical protein